MMGDHISKLGELLTEAGARVSIDRTRIAPSTLYDANYHVAIIACAFSLHAKRSDTGKLCMPSALLKMLQFIAARPVLLPDLRKWLKGRKNKRLDLMSQMPRGYLGDLAHERTVDYLIAIDALQKSNSNELFSGSRYQYLSDTADAIKNVNLLRKERHILRELKSIKISKTALEGR